MKETRLKPVKKVALMTFGCRANQYDTAALEHLLAGASYQLVNLDDEADVYVVNSCAITAQAEQEARQFLVKTRKKNPQAKMILTGCSAQVSFDDYAQLNVADHVVGNEHKGKILSLLAKDFDDPKATSLMPTKSGRFDSVFFEGGVPLSDHARSFLKIQDGCSQFCSFCIVPFARGLNRSVPPEQILASLYQLKEQGINEVVLTGIHLGTYGKDLAPRYSLYDLLVLLEERSPIKRIRLSSLDPEEVEDRLIDLLAVSKIFCEHMHLPLQSGDDGILKRMRRRYDHRLFLDLTYKLKEKVPSVCLGTDVIVGFPGEDEAAFEQTFSLLRDSFVDYFHVFPYSPRQGTKAALFKETVSPAMKKKRVRLLRELSEQKRSRFYASQIGFNLNAILEKRKNGFVAMTRNYIPVLLEGSGSFSAGDEVVVSVSGFFKGELMGSLKIEAGMQTASFSV